MSDASNAGFAAARASLQRHSDQSDQPIYQPPRKLPINKMMIAVVASAAIALPITIIYFGADASPGTTASYAVG
jgi:hypothetical protein